MLKLPEHFDTNEWFVIIAVIISYTFILFLPKRFPLSISLLVHLFSMAYAQAIDHIFAGTSYDLYDINDVGKYEWFDLLAWFLYPPFGYTFVYFYDKWKVGKAKLFWYILCWAFISIGVEYTSFKFHLFTYKQWKFSYAFPIYLITLSITLLFFIFIRRSFEKMKDSVV